MIIWIWWQEEVKGGRKKRKYDSDSDSESGSASDSDGATSATPGERARN